MRRSRQRIEYLYRPSCRLDNLCQRARRKSANTTTMDAHYSSKTQAIVSFAVLKRTSSSFSPHENNIAQTLATASGGMSNVFISGIPALYQLNLLTTPSKDFFRIVILTTIGGYFGLLSIAPCTHSPKHTSPCLPCTVRRFFIKTAARELNLVFPSSFATASTIRSMHSAAGGEKLAQKKMKWTVVAFVGAMLLRIASMFLPNVLWVSE